MLSQYELKIWSGRDQRRLVYYIGMKKKHKEKPQYNREKNPLYDATRWHFKGTLISKLRNYEWMLSGQVTAL